MFVRDFAKMSVSLSDSSNYHDSRDESDDDIRENEDEEVTEGSSETLGIAPYQFEPLMSVDESDDDGSDDGSSDDSSSDGGDDGPVRRLNNTNWYVRSHFNIDIKRIYTVRLDFV